MTKLDITDVKKLASWGRYLYWAELQHRDFENFIGSANDEDDAKRDWRYLAHMSLWLGSLWTVIEGWRELKLTDSVIDKYLNEEDFLNRLRRFRNSVFHFRPKAQLFDPRFLEFYKNNENNFLAWAFHYEFKRYLWMWPELHMVTAEQVLEMRESLEKLIGWMPSDILPAQIDSLRETIKDCIKTIGNDSLETPHAQELIMAINNGIEVLKGAPTESLPDIVRIALDQKFKTVKTPN